MAVPSWLAGLYGPMTPNPVPPPASLTVLMPRQQGTIQPSPPPTPPDLGEDRRTASVF